MIVLLSKVDLHPSPQMKGLTDMKQRNRSPRGVKGKKVMVNQTVINIGEINIKIAAPDGAKGGTLDDMMKSVIGQVMNQLGGGDMSDLNKLREIVRKGSSITEAGYPATGCNCEFCGAGNDCPKAEAGTTGCPRCGAVLEVPAKTGGEGAAEEAGSQ